VSPEVVGEPGIAVNHINVRQPSRAGGCHCVCCTAGRCLCEAKSRGGQGVGGGSALL
jgi:hypothetical protein